MKFVLATRKSPLALTQTATVAARLEASIPGATCELLKVVTTGDKQAEWSLAKQGGKGLFTAELEQAHGRLRTVHRTTPCTQIHVGMLCPDGWRAPIEEHVPTEGGRPRAPAVDVGALVRALGGIRKAARAVHVAPVTVLRWTRGERVPNEEAVAALDAAARGVADLACQGVLPKPPISKLLIGGFGNTQCVMKHGGAS